MVNLCCQVNIVNNRIPSVFAPITEAHEELISFQLPQAAQHLYNWLIRKCRAGDIQEFDKEDFDIYCQTMGRKPYSLQWFTNCLKKLFDTNLVKLIRRFRGYGYKIQAFHPWQLEDPILSDRNSNKTFKNSNKTFKKTTSNPDSVVPSYRDIKEKQYNTSKSTNQNSTKEYIACSSLKSSLTAFKDRISQGKAKLGISIQKPKIKHLKSNSKQVDRSTDKDLGEGESSAKKFQPVKKSKIVNQDWRSHLDQLDDLGIRVNPTIRNTVKTTATKTIEEAIAFYRQRKRSSKAIGNPCGYFMQIVKENWGKKPLDQSIEPENKEAQIRYWFDLARAIGACSQMETREDNQVWVCMSGNWEKLSDAWERGYTLEYLRKRNKN